MTPPAVGVTGIDGYFYVAVKKHIVNATDRRKFTWLVVAKGKSPPWQTGMHGRRYRALRAHISIRSHMWGEATCTQSPRQ